MRTWGFNSYNNKSNNTPEELFTVAKDYLAGKSIVHIAKNLGIRPIEVKRRLIKEDIKIRSNAEQKKLDRKSHEQK